MRAPKKFEVPKQFQMAMIAMTVVGFGAFGFKVMSDPLTAWNGYLIGFWFTLALALSGPFLNATQFLAIAGWSVTVRRIGEAFATFIPVSLVLFIGLYFGGSTLYEWWDPAVVAGDAILSKKAAMLDPTMFLIIGVVGLAVTGGVALFQRKISIEQDETGDDATYGLSKAMAFVYLFVFVNTISFLAWYTLMSLQPHWFSTMWSVYAFSAMFQTGLATTILVVLWLKSRDYFGDFVGERQIHDLGQLFFGFTVFYAYIGFSQFLLIWYANIPEEAIWFVTRGTPTDVVTDWDNFSVALPFLKFVVPFFLLLPQDHKKNKRKMLTIVASWIFILQIFEVWFWVAPTPHEHGALASAFQLPIFEIIIALGFVGLFGLVVSTMLSRANLIPVKDPFLHEAPGHHPHGVRPPKPEQIKIS